MNLSAQIKNLILLRHSGLAAYLESNSITAYRLLNRTQPGLAFLIDIYQDNAVVHVFEKSAEGLIEPLEKALSGALNIKSFFYKNRSRSALELPAGEPKQIIQTEYGLKFKVDLAAYQDTGLFLDQRENRRWLATQSQGKTVLNTFAYSGAFSVYAAAAGAARTYSVDISAPYCRWIKENLALNGLNPEANWVYRMDTLEFFQYALKKNLRFDVIIIDPPTFSKNKGKSFAVQRDYPALISGALALLNQDGFIFFSNNYQGFRFKKADVPPCTVTEKTDSLPPDFSGTIPHRCFIIKPLKRQE
jgi:23S rRNA G2069 N7-methylase RlmK/C1962 C5-methylase RlmI